MDDASRARGNEIVKHLGDSDVVEFAKHAQVIEACAKSGDPDKVFHKDFAEAFKSMRRIAQENGCDVQCTIILKGSLQRVEFSLLVPTQQRGH